MAEKYCQIKHFEQFIAIFLKKNRLVSLKYFNQNDDSENFVVRPLQGHSRPIPLFFDRPLIGIIIARAVARLDITATSDTLEIYGPK